MAVRQENDQDLETGFDSRKDREVIIEERKIPLNEREERIIENLPSYQAFQILKWAFVLVPLIAGIDKFFNGLTNWEQYLSGPFNVFNNAFTTMYVVGVIEIIAAIGVALVPRVMSYVLSLWLLLIIINLFTLGSFYDIALRDFGLLLGTMALGRLSEEYDANTFKKFR